jgi:hypothetical protein
MEGWIKLHRCLIDSFVFANPTTLKIWIWLLIKATKKKRIISLKIGVGFQDIEINPGELIFGRFKAEEQLNIDGSTIYKHIKKLEDSGNIMLISNNHYTIITICKWNDYQDNETIKEQPDNNQVTAKEQQSNNRVTTEEHKQESKEYKESNIKYIYDSYPAKCFISGRATGKCAKNKEKIEKLLKINTFDKLLAIVNCYLEDCKTHNTYIKNFGTFLNNLPEIPEMSDKIEEIPCDKPLDYFAEFGGKRQ